MNQETNVPNESDYVVFDKISFTHKQIFNVVDSFYRKVSQHPNLSQPFASVDHWPDHIERMTQFWWMKLGGEAYTTTQYAPIPKHYEAGFNSSLLNDWLELFSQTLQEQELSEEQITTWKAMTQRIGIFLTKRNEAYTQLKTSGHI